MLNLHLQKRVKCDRLSGFFITNLRHSSQFEKYPHLINLSKTVKSKNVKAGKTELIELKGSPAPGIFSKPLDVNTLFGDPEKSGYLKPDTRPFRVRAMDVIRHLPTELKLRAAHISRNFRPFSGYIEGVERHNDHMYLPNSNFRELSDEEFAQWQTLCDSDWNEGYSRVELVRTRGTRTALFRGNYCTRIPRTGDVRQTGYVGLFSPTYKSGLFSYQDYWLKCFTHLVIRYRGDGRTYLLQLHCPSYIDLTQCAVLQVSF